MAVAENPIDKTALRFFRWLYESPLVEMGGEESLEGGITRDRVADLFRVFRETTFRKKKNKTATGKLETRVMTSLRLQNLMRSQRWGKGGVICVFALDEESKRFAPRRERTVARVQILQKQRELRSNKAGIFVSEQPVISDPDGIETPHTTAHINDNNNNNNNNNNHDTIVPVGKPMILGFELSRESCYEVGDDFVEEEDDEITPSVELSEVRLTGPHEKHFTVLTETPLSLSSTTTNGDGGAGLMVMLPRPRLRLAFEATRIAAHRATVTLKFLRTSRAGIVPSWNGGGDDGGGGLRLRAGVTIVRDILLRSGDPELYTALEPKKPYTKRKKRRNEPRIDPKDVVHPPREAKNGGRGGGYRGLGPFRIPKNYQKRVETGDLEETLVPFWEVRDSEDDENEEDNDNDNDNNDNIGRNGTPSRSSSSFGRDYAGFWQSLLWASELQAYEDIRFFDLHEAELTPDGHRYRLHVPGLAEGRPSVLRGDLVKCRWNGKEYRGRVAAVGQLDVGLDFHPGFRKTFDARVDRIETVRFTFSRTNFRTNHAGVLAAFAAMGRPMLLPSREDVPSVPWQTGTARFLDNGQHRFPWTSALLNDEQKRAVREIAVGSLRPLPHVIFGPPGTGYVTAGTRPSVRCLLAGRGPRPPRPTKFFSLTHILSLSLSIYLSTSLSLFTRYSVRRCRCAVLA